MSRMRILRPLFPVLLSVVTIAVFAAPARAQLPWLPNSVVESRIVGCPTGDPLPSCAAGFFPQPGFTVLVRDMFNLPLADQVVTLVFTDPAIKLFEDSRRGTVVDCAARTISRRTDTTGLVTFAPRIGGTSLFNSAEVWVGGILFGILPVTTTDLDGNGTTGLADLSLFSENFLDHNFDARTDFDGCVHAVNGATTLADLGIFAPQFGMTHPEGACP